MKNYLNRILSVMCAAFVACAMLIGSTAPVAAASSWDVYLNTYAFVGQEEGVYAGNYKTGADATVTSVKSSNSKVIKVTKYKGTDDDGNKVTWFALKCKKTGKAKVTVKFKTSGGAVKTKTKTIKVKKYPDPIGSLKINGKSVNVSENKYDYYKKYTKKTAKIKFATQNGWKISDASIDMYTSNGKSKTVKSAKTVLKKGKSISFPKKYSDLYIWVEMTNGSEYIYYSMDLYR